MNNTLKAILVFTVALTVSVFAQPNFTGTWTLDKDKSDLGEGRRGGMAATTLTVDHGAKLEIERVSTGRDGEERKMTETLTLDGKKCTNVWFRGDKESTVTFSSDKNTLIITSIIAMNFNGNDFELNSEEKWSLDKDGKVLTIEAKSTTPRGDREQTLVYNKAE